MVVSGFYDSMNDSAVCYIIDQTEMATIYCEHKYVDRLLQMKREGKIQSLKNIIDYDAPHH